MNVVVDVQRNTYWLAILCTTWKREVNVWACIACVWTCSNMHTSSKSWMSVFCCFSFFFPYRPNSRWWWWWWWRLSLYICEWIHFAFVYTHTNTPSTYDTHLLVHYTQCLHWNYFPMALLSTRYACIAAVAVLLLLRSVVCIILTVTTVLILKVLKSRGLKETSINKTKSG